MMPLITHLLGSIRTGYLTVRDVDGTIHAFGTRDSDPSATLVVRHPGLYRRILRSGSLGLGESYMDGWWDEEHGNLVGVIGILLANDVTSRLPPTFPLLLSRLRHSRVTRSDHRRARRNIAKHYDLDNVFYELFLDRTMGYTCGYQLRPTDTSEQMQDQKHDLVCRKLGLKPGERVADLGCGFGGMLRYAAKHYGIRGIGCTLSTQQAEWANRRIQEEGLGDRIQVHLRDYRDMRGSFDKIVSIGMAEHVWSHGYAPFLRVVSSLVPDGGIGLVHTIGTTAAPRRAYDPWFNTYIFPGARLPRLQELVTGMQESGLTIGHVENLKPHYAETLRRWREKFERNRTRIASLGPRFDERFLRMWEYYLQASEATFRHGPAQLYQLLFCKGKRWSLPMRCTFDAPQAAAAPHQAVPRLAPEREPALV